MKNKIKQNYFFNVSYQLFALLVPLIVTPYLSHVLKVDGIGIYSFTYSIVSYFILFAALGSSNFGIKTIGSLQDNIKKRTIEFWNIFLFRLFSSLIFLIFYFIYVFIFSSNKLISCIQALYLIGLIFDISWFYQGLEDFKIVSIRNFIVKIVNVILIFIFVKSKNDLWIYVFLLSSMTLLGNLTMWLTLKKYLTKVFFNEINPISNVKEIFLLFIPTIAIQLFSVLDKSMIGFITSSNIQNGLYEQAEKIVKMALMLITTLSTVKIPAVAREYKNGNIDKVKSLLYSSFVFNGFLGFSLMFGLIGISKLFVPVFFGYDFIDVIPILCVLSFLFVEISNNYTIGSQFLVAIGKQNIYTKHLIIGGLFNFLLNLILINKFAALGAAIASVIGEFVILLLNYNFLFSEKIFNFSKILSLNIKYFISGFIMCIILLYLTTFFKFNWFSLFLIICLGVFIYIFLLFILKDEYILTLLRKIKDGFYEKSCNFNNK